MNLCVDRSLCPRTQIDPGELVQSQRELIVTQNTTLDGVIDATEGWFTPAGDDNEDIEAALRRQMQAQDALLLGRRTFEEMRGYWPLQTDDTTGIADHLNAVQKYVMSSTLKDPEWENTTVLRGALQIEVEALKAAPGGAIGITGSISLMHALIAAGLVDEYRLVIHPVVLGAGTPFWPEVDAPLRLRNLQTRAFASGAELRTYVPS